MANINLSYQFKDGIFKLCATVKGTSQRHYKTTEGLINPNFEHWNQKDQLFHDATNDAIHNNKVLLDMKKLYQYYIDSFNPTNGKELFGLHDVACQIEAKKALTFGGYLRKMIENMRSESNKKPSKHYQNFIALLHKLEKEGNIINVALSEINNKHFIAFGQYILSLSDKEGRKNFKEIMSRFKTVHNRAFEHELNDNVLRYKYKNDAPIREPKKRKALTEKQYEKFVNLDLSAIYQSGVNGDFYKELYHDFGIFMYEMKMRPVDVIKLHCDEIVKFRGKLCVSYTPEKKKNLEKAVVVNVITPKANSIIAKYKGRSSKGYIFPFTMNEYDWNFRDAESWNKWNNRKQATMERVNKFLKKVAVVLKLNPDDLINYTFRHSTFTHEIKSNKKPLLQIAKEGGTGIEMLESHYYDYINAI